jgi:hypothetical protein
MPLQVAVCVCVGTSVDGAVRRVREAVMSTRVSRHAVHEPGTKRPIMHRFVDDDTNLCWLEGDRHIATWLHAAALGCAALTPLSQPLDNQQETVVAATCTHSAVLWVCSGPQAAVMSPPHSFSRLLRKFVFENIQRLLSWPAHGVHPC